jgi:hypothetical protein
LYDGRDEAGGGIKIHLLRYGYREIGNQKSEIGNRS